jgi:uncharacterized protein
MGSFQFANSSQPVPDAKDIPIRFSITTAPATDVWDKPPATHSFSAPILYQVLPLKSFKRAKVSVVAEWKHLYDQGGLILVIHQKHGSNEQQTKKWIKTGIEFTAGKPHVSVVATDRWSDWSLAPVPSGGNAATIEIVREEEQDNTLWVYLVDGDSRFPLREVTWAFEGEEAAECWVGAYAAKPYSSADSEDLTVDFQGLLVETVA